MRARLERGERQNRPYFRMAAVAACLVVLLGAAVGAAGFHEAWRYFFPGVPERAVTEVDVSQTNGDYTLTVEDAVADDTGMLLLLSLTRTDGAEIDPDLQLGGGSQTVAPFLMLDGEEVHFGGGVVEQTLSGDGKTLYLVYEATSSGHRLSGKTITFTVPAPLRRYGDPADHRLSGPAGGWGGGGAPGEQARLGPDPLQAGLPGGASGGRRI